jgi:quinol monooxygenase YgiN
MSKIAIFAEFATHPGTFDQFLERMKIHAAASRQEPGCLRFDIAVPDKSENRLLLFELYKDRAAFDFHASTDRIKAHRDTTAPWTAERKVSVCEMIDSGDK